VNFRDYAQDPDRLWTAVKQLVHGVSALHAAGKLHRDIKPSNVLVTREGRLVIVDFGLVTDATGDAVGGRDAIAGTPAYLSPEQRAGLPLSEASDW
jgi:serine/threonine protein kinase